MVFSTATKEGANITGETAKATAASAKRDLRNVAEDAKHDLTDMAANAGRQVRHLIDTASDQLTDASDRVSREVRENPVRSSLIALGVGFIIGALVRR